MSDLHLAAVEQEVEYERLTAMFYSALPSGGGNEDTPKVFVPVSSSSNLTLLELPMSSSRSKSPLQHSRSAPYELKQLAPTSTSTETSPSPSYKPIHDAFSTWDDAPVIRPKRESKETVLQKFEAQEKKFCERFLKDGNLSGIVSPADPASPVAESSMDASGIPQSLAGTEHLGNLVKLLEQLSILHEQNAVLRKKCAYLEDVRTLLRAKAMPYGFVDSGHKERKGESLITRAQSKVMHYLGTPSSNGMSRRESRVASDSSEGRPPHSLHKRSQSVGSIDLVEAELTTPIIKPATTTAAPNHRNSNHGNHHHHHEHGKSASSSGNKSPSMRLQSKKHGKRFSKWMRVKKVFSGKQDQQSRSMDGGEGGGGVGGGTVSATQLVRSNKHLTGKLTQMKSVDDGLLSPRELTRADIPPSPSSVQSEPNSFVNDDDDYEDYEEYVESVALHSSSTPSTDGFPTLRTAPRRLKDTEAPQVSLSDSEHADVTETQALKRRKSSPTLGFFRQGEEDAFVRGSLSRLSRSSSLIETISRSKSPEKKSAWNKVKDIIHTRKDSLKKTRKVGRRTLSAGEAGGNDADSEISPDSSSWEGRAPLNTDIDPHSPVAKAANVAGVVAATAPTPKLVRRYTAKAASSRSQSPQSRGSGHRRRGGSVKGTPDSPATAVAAVPPTTLSSNNKRESLLGSSSPPLDVAALMGGMSDDFSKKMQEWEEKKKHGAFDKDSGGMAAEDMKNTDGSAKFSEEFIKKMVEWEKIKGPKGSMSPPKRASMYDTFPLRQPSPGSISPPPPARQPSPTGGNEQQQQPQNLSESFSKTVQEWQRVKETRARSTTSPTPPELQQQSSSSLVQTIAKPFEHRKSRKEQRSKSRDRDRDKSKQRFEKERQKIEKKEKKIEHERLKLEQLKMKLDLENRPSHEQELSEEFVKKLQEWEIMNGIRRQGSHKRSGSEKLPRDSVSVAPQGGRERILSDPSAGDKLLHLPVPLPMGEMRAGGGREEEEGKSEESTETIKQKLEAENARLREEVEEKDEDIALIQDELEQLTCRFNMMNKEHSEQTENFKRELWATSRLGKYTIESDLLSATIRELHGKIAHMKNYDDQIWAAKEEVEQRSLKESEQRNRLESSLLCEIEQLQVALDRKIHRHGPEVLHQLYQYVIGIQEKLYDLRLGVIERNRVIEDLKRHLLVQEVTNKLLLADMQRKEMQLGFYRGCQRGGVIKRWKTFSGHDRVLEASIMAAKANSEQAPPPLPDVPASCQDIDKSLRQLSHGFGDSLNLHFEWLDGLKQQIKEVEEGASKSIQTSCPELTETESQTVMTLCRASSFLPVSGRSTPPNDKGVQTSDTEDPVKAKRDQFKQSHSTTPVKPARLNKAAKLARQKSTGSGSFDSNSSSIEDKLLRAEEHREVDKAAEKVERKEEVPCSNGKDFNDTSARRKSTGGFVTETETETTTETTTKDSVVDHHQPPPSPIIRSKYPRKLKTTDVRIHQLYGDGRTWQATPPRKVMRQRGKIVTAATTTSAGSHDEAADPEKDESDAKLGPMRERTRSDGAVFHYKVSQTLSVPTKNSTGALWTGSRQDDKPPTGVTDLVNRYEDGRPISQECRLSPTALRKPTVSPVRRLKTAAELMKDSEVRKRSRSATRENRERWQPSPRTRDDKENTEVPASRVKRLVQQLSGESTPSSVDPEEDRQRRADIKQLSHQLRSSSTSELQGKSIHPLNDLTNESSRTLVQKMKESLLCSSGENTPRLTPPKTVPAQKRLEAPKEGTVTSAKEKFEPIRQNLISQQSSATVSISSLKQPRPRPVSCPRGSSESTDRDSEELVWELAVPPKPATPPPTVRSSQLPQKRPSDRGGKLGCGSGSGGAISALCMHAASLDLEDSSPDRSGANSREEVNPTRNSELTVQQQQQQQPQPSTSAAATTSPDKKGKGKTKFLDGNWLPKKFFRVSNGYLEVDSSNSVESDVEASSPSPATLWSSSDTLFLDCVPPSSWSSLSLSREESVC